MYLFHVCFTGLHLVSLWLQDVHLRFILDVYLKKKQKQQRTTNITQQAFNFPTSALFFTVGACHVSFHDQFSICILLVISPGWRRANAGSKSSEGHHRALRTVFIRFLQHLNIDIFSLAFCHF